ncbi:MAG: complex I NDUFA9 subunit family protein [bacterium]|nr:complex I NDUFA9 subunit family protein [bacterium]MDT8367227.1 complex I NDUFA9 subunit family protein [bacterium]
MIVAVTGGTGFVGRAVVKELLERGHQVRILSRKAPERLPEGASHVVGSVVTGEGLDSLVEGTEAVIHLVGIIKEVGENTFRAAHYNGTLNILAASARAGVPRYLHMSAMGTRKDAVSQYHMTKYAAEEAVRASGLGWTIFRPSTIFGPGDAFINMLAAVMRKSPVMPVVGGGKNLMQPVYVKDVGAAFRKALDSDVHIGKTYELGGPDLLNLKQILVKVSHVIELKRLFISIPLWVVSPVVKSAQLFKIPLPVTSDQLIMLGEDNIRTGGDPVEELGLDWTGFEEGIRTYLGPNRE